MKNDYYVYAYLDPRKPGYYSYDDVYFCFEPFYIGKGKGKRIFQSIVDNNNTKSKKQRIIDIRKQGFEPIAIKVYNNVSENIGYILEKYLINKIGIEKENGVLVNKSKGHLYNKQELNLFRSKFIKNSIVNVIGITSNFYYLHEGSVFHKDLFFEIFEEFNYKTK